jgi:SulP family sulfate permease
MLKRSSQSEVLGDDHIIVHKSEALSTVYRQLDSDVCRRCTLRVFEECQHTLPNGEARADTPPRSTTP